MEGEINMDKLLIHLMQSFILTLFIWSATLQAESIIHWENEREYRVTVSDNNKPLLSIAVEYLGKTPNNNKIIKHNWKAVDTDFYRETIKNLSESDIHIKEIKYSLDRGQLYTPRIKGGNKIKATYGTHVIKANESLSRDNAWVWSKRDNTLHRIFKFTWNDKTMDVDIPFVYQK